MSEWDVERRWRISAQDDAPYEVTTPDLGRSDVCCLLGAAGSGKTFELHRLARIETPGRWRERVIKLALCAENSDRLFAKLDSAAGSGADTIYLDALDEALAQNRLIDEYLAEWIGRPDRPRTRLRISCRSTVWPDVIAEAARTAYGADSVCVARIEPFSEADVGAVARAEGVDPDGFIDQVRRSNASALATLPLSLGLMLRLYRQNRRLPTSRSDLFRDAVSHLMIERETRRRRGTGPSFDARTIAEAAERLACYSLFSGRDVVDLGDDPTEPSALGWRELERAGEPGLAEPVVREVCRCGLFESAGTHRFRFIHRQIAEYLAGRTVARLLPHQAKALLASPDGWRAGVSSPWQETAAFAAMHNEEVARWVAEHDPEVIGLSDVANPELRRMAFRQFAERFRRHELTDFQVDWEKIPWFGLRYEGLDDDLRPILKQRAGDLDDLLAFAVALVRALGLSDLHEELADLALDPSAPMKVRTAASRALGESASRNAKRRLKPLIADSRDDRNQELKGLALRCCWPEDMSSGELLTALTPRAAQNYFGSYASFLAGLPHYELLTV